MLSCEAANKFEPTGLKPTIYCTLGKHANHYTTDAMMAMNVSYMLWLYNFIAIYILYIFFKYFVIIIYFRISGWWPC